MTSSAYRSITNEHTPHLPVRTRDDLQAILPLFALLATLLVSPLASTAPYQGWSLPGADEGGGHFSHATQITPDNVNDLSLIHI